MRTEFGRKDWVCSITKYAGRILLYPFFRLKTDGTENLPKNSAFILLPKHQRWEDIPLLALAAPRSLYYVAKSELFKNPLGSWYLRSVGGIPLNRQRPLESRRSIKALIEFAKKGEGIVVFPEGTYYRGRMGPGQTGMVRLILSRLKVSFIPVGINYSKEGARTLVRIRFGNAFYGDSSAPPGEFLDCIMKEIAQLSGM
ncbi:MAG: 1-acyl-sn-glycerol-3-phosphate acyltransferase [Deltaproteobacteria bacterium]|nr:1-acyl-sn-glycerol-3-phosphate acyltransferase [Deltaproteobacteria bacterium]MBW2117850.1 1-acyl-sn-glycerol-3-phosphate acyltransferase [Deltaproteobacteria bacterium]MBW2343592.1 1-acyl-sn-glycerol-3-phosphate acyltransferase [Deltaproteobacteria bacterium]